SARVAKEVEDESAAPRLAARPLVAGRLRRRRIRRRRTCRSRDGEPSPGQEGNPRDALVAAGLPGGRSGPAAEPAGATPARAGGPGGEGGPAASPAPAGALGGPHRRRVLPGGGRARLGVGSLAGTGAFGASGGSRGPGSEVARSAAGRSDGCSG